MFIATRFPLDDVSVCCEVMWGIRMEVSGTDSPICYFFPLRWHHIVFIGPTQAGLNCGFDVQYGIDQYQPGHSILDSPNWCVPSLCRPGGLSKLRCYVISLKVLTS